MPKVVRNFWVNLRVDGKETAVGTGPASKDGGFTQDVLIRSGGDIEKVMTIQGHANSDGTLVLLIADGDGNTVHKITRHRDKSPTELDHETLLTTMES